MPIYESRNPKDERVLDVYAPWRTARGYWSVLGDKLLYNNLTMTRVEKLQKLTRLIHQEYRTQEPIAGYSKGDTVSLHSVQIEQSTGITPDEQADALTILADKYGCIEYTAVKDYASEDELSPDDLLHIAEIASIGDHSPDHIRQTVLSGVTYKITVTSSLADVINVLNGNLCELVIESGVTPVITIDESKYTLLSLQDGTVPQKIIGYASKHYDSELTLSDLQTLNIAQLKQANYNVAQTFKNNIFGRGNLLEDFAIITPKTLLLKSTALLTEDKIAAIKKSVRH
jgi:hypothetical protein